MVGVTKAAGYSWLERWNSSGYEGLIPEFGGGRHSKLTEDQKEELREIKERDSWTTKEVQELIEEEFGVKYSSWQENSKIVWHEVLQALSRRLQET